MYVCTYPICMCVSNKCYQIHDPCYDFLAQVCIEEVSVWFGFSGLVWIRGSIVVLMKLYCVLVICFSLSGTYILRKLWHFVIFSEKLYLGLKQLVNDGYNLFVLPVVIWFLGNFRFLCFVSNCWVLRINSHVVGLVFMLLAWSEVLPLI